jgi:hypothetical protein
MAYEIRDKTGNKIGSLVDPEEERRKWRFEIELSAAQAVRQSQLEQDPDYVIKKFNDAEQSFKNLLNQDQQNRLSRIPYTLNHSWECWYNLSKEFRRIQEIFRAFDNSVLYNHQIDDCSKYWRQCLNKCGYYGTRANIIKFLLLFVMFILGASVGAGIIVFFNRIMGLNIINAGTIVGGILTGGIFTLTVWVSDGNVFDNEGAGKFIGLIGGIFFGYFISSLCHLGWPTILLLIAGGVLGRLVGRKVGYTLG